MKGMTTASTDFTAPCAAGSHSIPTGRITLDCRSVKFTESFENSRLDQSCYGSCSRTAYRCTGVCDRGMRMAVQQPRTSSIQTMGVYG